MQVSLPDLRSAVQTLQMDLSEPSVLALFAYLDEGRSGAVSRAAWTRALATANADAVLESRGVSAGGGGEARGGAGGEARAGAGGEVGALTLQESIDTVAAALAFNSLAVDAGYPHRALNTVLP